MVGVEESNIHAICFHGSGLNRNEVQVIPGYLYHSILICSVETSAKLTRLLQYFSEYSEATKNVQKYMLECQEVR